MCASARRDSTAQAAVLGHIYAQRVSDLHAAAPLADDALQAEAAEQLRRYISNEVLPQLPPSDAQHQHWGIVLALSAGATTTYEAAIRLACDGFGYQAAMLNRSLFEAIVDCHWTTMNPELAVQRVREHTAYMARVKARTAAKYPRQFGDLPLPGALSEEDDKRLRKLFRGGTGSWTGLNLHDRVKAISSRWAEGMAREQLFYVRDIVNGINNSLLHSTPWGMARMTRPLEERSGASAGRRAEIGPSAAFRRESLFASFWMASALARMLLDECGLDSEEFENGLYARGIGVFVLRSPRAP